MTLPSHAREAAIALKDHVDALFQQATDAGEVPGVVAMATDTQGTIYEGAFGRRILGQPAAMTTDTVAWIASMTKALTGTAAMQLVEQGKLELDAPASQWAPELAELQVLAGWKSDGRPRLRPPKQTPTLRQLLTHTAGFGYDLWSEDLVRYRQAKGLPGTISCENAALSTPLLFDPGERWFYGINLDWVGKVVEAASGKKLGAYLQECVFEPLGMVDSAFKITPAMRRRLAKIHQREEDGSLTPLMELELPQQPEFEMGGGGLYSTAGDYLKFVRMILNRGRVNGTQLLREETVREMSRNQMGGAKVTPLATAIPQWSNDAEFFPGVPKSWGLTFMINEEPAPTGRTAGSLAWAGLANSYFWIDPTKGIGGVYIAQVLPFVDEKSLRLYYAFEQAVYESLH